MSTPSDHPFDMARSLRYALVCNPGMFSLLPDALDHAAVDREEVPETLPSAQAHRAHPDADAALVEWDMLRAPLFAALSSTYRSYGCPVIALCEEQDGMTRCAGESRCGRASSLPELHAAVVAYRNEGSFRGRMRRRQMCRERMHVSTSACCRSTIARSAFRRRGRKSR